MTEDQTENQTCLGCDCCTVEDPGSEMCAKCIDEGFEGGSGS